MPFSLTLLNLQQRTTYSVNLDNLQGLTSGLMSVQPDSDVGVTATEKPSIGYSWAVMSNTCGDRMTLVNDDMTKLLTATSNLMGGDSYQREFTFQSPSAAANYVKEPCSITFAYKRPWLSEPDSPNDVKTVFFNI